MTTTQKINRDGDLNTHDDVLVSIAPASGDEVARYPVASSDEVRSAIERGRETLGWWNDLGFDGRTRALLRWRAEIAKGADELLELIHRENGKTRDTACADLLQTFELIEWAAENAERVLGGRDVPSPFVAAHLDGRVEYRPYGVVGVIGPWNWPAATPMGIIPFAMAAGNAVVFKPSELTPAVGVWLVDAWDRAVPGRPVFQAVVGFAATGQALIEEGVDKVAFTGSVRTGNAVMRAAAERLTPMLLELGGKDAVIVADDADVETAAREITWGALTNSGLGCIALERAIVVESLYDDFIEATRAEMAKIKAGEDGPGFIGPITLPAQVETIRAHIADALERGARVLTGGLEGIDPPYVAPTLVVDVPRDALIATEETFGPVLAVIKVKDVDEAVVVANETAYGLGSAVYSAKNGWDIARRLRAGMTSINTPLGWVMFPSLPFGGGAGASGFGRKHGDEGLLEFAQPFSIASQEREPKMTTSTLSPPPDMLKGVVKMVAGKAIEKGADLVP